jgi:hypothetical protein
MRANSDKWGAWILANSKMSALEQSPSAFGQYVQCSCLIYRPDIGYWGATSWIIII